MSKRRTPNGKRTRDLLALLPPGLRIEKRGRHLSVLLADGSQLRDGRGMPVLVAGTSTLPVEREAARVRRALREAGLLDSGGDS